jgi:hypothetical protein
VAAAGRVTIITLATNRLGGGCNPAAPRSRSGETLVFLGNPDTVVVPGSLQRADRSAWR